MKVDLVRLELDMLRSSPYISETEFLNDIDRIKDYAESLGLVVAHSGYGHNSVDPVKEGE